MTEKRSSTDQTKTVKPSRDTDGRQMRTLIKEIKSTRSRLNPPGKRKLKIKDLVNQSRP